MLVRVRIVVPERLTDEERELYTRLLEIEGREEGQGLLLGRHRQDERVGEGMGAPLALSAIFHFLDAFVRAPARKMRLTSRLQRCYSHSATDRPGPAKNHATPGTDFVGISPPGEGLTGRTTFRRNEVRPPSGGEGGAAPLP